MYVDKAALASIQCDYTIQSHIERIDCVFGQINLCFIGQSEKKREE